MNRDLTEIRIPENAVFSDGRYFLISMPHWNVYSETQNELVAIHDCDQTTKKPYFVAMPICEPCTFCGRIASDKIQTLYVLHNGHY